MIKTYFEQNKIEKKFYEHPAFDLIDIIYQKLLQETNGVQEEIFQCLEKYCCEHIQTKNNTIMYQDTIYDLSAVETCIAIEAQIYELVSDNRLSKIKIIANTDGMASEISSSFHRIYDSSNCFSIEYKKEQSLYNNYGVEWDCTIRSYRQLIPNKMQLQQILSTFPFDPDIWNIPFLSEVYIKRTRYLNTAYIQILVPSIHSMPYFCEYGLQIKKPEDLLHLELSNPCFPDLAISKICNHNSIPKNGIIYDTEEERKRKEKQLCDYIHQLSNEQTREFLIDYIHKEDTYDSNKTLQLTLVNFINE